MNVVADTATVMVNGVGVEVIERGREGGGLEGGGRDSGGPLLFLHPGIGIERSAPVLDGLARGARLIAPSHPGFGRSELPQWMNNVDDLAYFYLDFLETLDLTDVTLVGVSLGGWIAAAIAVKSTERLARLVLANPVGIKVGDRETRDIVDIFAITDAEFDELAYFDAKLARRDYGAMPDAEVMIAARNREATGRFAWSPYMHDPKLLRRLHRIRIPTLFLWGAADRILGEAYGRAYAAAIPGARFEPIARAGHFPHLEQPDEFARRVLAFAAARPS
jgi:pimeloyl-ACP methyl ester carboxylesterase